MKKMETISLVWDYDISESTYLNILHGKETMGHLNRDWAAVRMLEYATYREIVLHIGFLDLIQNWHRWRSNVRSASRKRGLDWLVEWLPKTHPEKCA